MFLGGGGLLWGLLLRGLLLWRLLFWRLLLLGRLGLLGRLPRFGLTWFDGDVSCVGLFWRSRS